MNNYFSQTKNMIGSGARVTLKLIVILGIIIVLLIPQNMISDLIREREYRQQDIENSIASQVGGAIDISGPILVIPYQQEVETVSIDENKKEKIVIEKVEHYAYFNANELNITSQAEVENKKKSIYKVPFIQSQNMIQGNFTEPNFAKWTEIKPELILWQKAFILLGVSDLNGITENPILNWNSATINFEPGGKETNLYNSSIHANLPENWNTAYNFEIDINARGTSSLNFASSAKSNTMTMKSNWPDPNFEPTQSYSETYSGEEVKVISSGTGTLPTNYDIYKDNSGFEANWSESQFSIDQLPQWLSTENQTKLNQRTMGVGFVNLSDSYSKVSRSIKYMAMIIALVFTAFFIIELLKSNRVHPFQYTLVGSAIAVFFLLLLALSEYIGFNWAYLIAAIATTALVGLYSISVFKNRQLAVSISIILSVLFAFIFVILNATEYSLILGAIGLFAILAIVMYVTRNITWYSNAEG